MKHSEHVFHDDTKRAESRTRIVMFLTATMMVVEIAAGSLFRSMALLADGWHMSTHTVAFLIAVVAYRLAEKHRHDPRFSFGTGKIGVLGGFTSSILLLVVAAAMIYESVLRFLHPVAIAFGEALVIAVVGLAVNLLSALILKDGGGEAGHHHGRGAGHSQGAAHGADKNLKAAYIHVIADAFTSVTAILALLLGLLYGIRWIDSLMGILGSLVIIAWAFGIIRETVLVLTDYLPKDSDLDAEIRGALGALPGTVIHDLHIWQLCPGKFAAIVALEAAEPRPLEDYYGLVDRHEELVHLTIQVNRK